MQINNLSLKRAPQTNNMCLHFPAMMAIDRNNKYGYVDYFRNLNFVYKAIGICFCLNAEHYDVSCRSCSVML